MNKLYKYFTFGEVFPSCEPNSSTSDIDITSYLTTYGFTIEDSSASTLLIMKQVVRMVFARFYKYYVLRKRVDWNVDPSSVVVTSDDVKNIVRQIIVDFNNSAPRFLPLLKSFNDNSSDPIGKVSSTTTGSTRFNDTPQDSGDFSDDSHTTNITQSSATTEADSGSIMERLDALYRNWRSILVDWTQEFTGIFYCPEWED